MRFQFSLILLIAVLACANAGVRGFFGRLRNGGNVQSQENIEVGLGTRFAEQFNKLTKGVMADTALAFGLFFDAIQSDLSNVQDRLKKQGLSDEIRKQINDMIADIKQFMSILTSAVDQGLIKTFKDLMNQSAKILPNIAARISALLKAGVNMGNLFPDTWKQIKEMNILKALMKDLNPARLFEFIKKLLGNFSLNGMLNGMLNGGLGGGLGGKLGGGLGGGLNLGGLGGGLNLGGLGGGLSLGGLSEGLSNGLGSLLGGLGGLGGKLGGGSSGGLGGSLSLGGSGGLGNLFGGLNGFLNNLLGGGLSGKLGGGSGGGLGGSLNLGGLGGGLSLGGSGNVRTAASFNDVRDRFSYSE